MAASEALASIALTTADIPDCLRLSDEAGWNQTGDDWRVFLEDGSVVGIRDAGGVLVASAAALPYDGDFGFVSMVLVTAAWRRRGLATRLLNECVDFLRARGLTPVLDATPAGAEVYGRQGFQGLFGIERWQIDRPSQGASLSANIREARPEDRDAIKLLDMRATGAGRDFLLDDFLMRDDSRAFVAHGGTGFAIMRRGRRATQLGPVVAASLDDAQALFLASLDAASDAVFVDVPTESGMVEWLASLGFVKQRGFTRMALGRSIPFGRPQNIFAVAGPEFG